MSNGAIFRVVLAGVCLSAFAVSARARTEVKLGLADVSNPLSLVAEDAVSSQQLDLEVKSEDDFEAGSSVIYYNADVKGRTFSADTARKNAEQASIGGYAGIYQPFFAQRALFNFEFKARKLIGRAIDLDGGTGGRHWSPSAIGGESSIALPLLLGAIRWTPRFGYGYEKYIFEQDEKDEFLTVSNSSNHVQIFKFANELSVIRSLRTQLVISNKQTQFTSRPSRFSDGRSDTSLPTERLRYSRGEIGNQVELANVTLNLMGFTQDEADLRQSALNAKVLGGKAGIEFTDLFSFKPSLEFEIEERKFENFRSGNVAQQDLTSRRKDKVTTLSFKISRSFRIFDVDLLYTQRKTDSNFKEAKISNELIAVYFRKEI